MKGRKEETGFGSASDGRPSLRPAENLKVMAEEAR